jgi:thiamine biosynthesis lipoprotein
MACLFEVTLPFSERFGVPVARDALDEIDRLERQLTVFQDSSEVSFINRNAAVRQVRVEGSLFELLQSCRTINRDTEGAFDISSGPLTRCWGFFKRQGRIPHSDELENAMAVVGGDKVILDSESRAIRFALSGVEINFGSIGKGYALDRVSALVRRQVSSALLSAGSSSICALGSGDPDESGWSVGIRHSRDKSRRLALLRMRNCAMSTSGSEEQFFEHDGRRYGHIIDPRSGRPADLVSSVTVVAGSAAIADALATGFYVGGRELAERYCAAHTNVLVIMLESKSEDPVVIGSHSGCKVAII